VIAEAAPELDHLHADVARGGATSSYKYSAGRLGELMRLLTQRDSSSIWASHKSRSHARLIEAAAVTLGRRKGRRSGSVQAVVCNRNLLAAGYFFSWIHC